MFKPLSGLQAGNLSKILKRAAAKAGRPATEAVQLHRLGNAMKVLATHKMKKETRAK